MFVLKAQRTFLQNVVQKKAKDLGIEGTAQSSAHHPSGIAMVICGEKEKLSDLIDILHKHGAEKQIEDLQIEPFIKVKDYRGVFRIIE
jgi:acylphosphatase